MGQISYIVGKPSEISLPSNGEHIFGVSPISGPVTTKKNWLHMDTIWFAGLHFRPDNMDQHESRQTSSRSNVFQSFVAQNRE